MEHDLTQTRESDICLRLEKLTGHRWETHVVLRLREARKPMRWAALKRAIGAAAGDPVPDNTLSSVLMRLTNHGQVHWELDEDLHGVYMLTPDGQQRATTLSRCLQVAHI